MLGRWRAGTEPQQKTMLRLRHAYHAALLVAGAYDAETAQGWFFGSNGKLDDEAPARVLRNAQTVDDPRLVVPAAKSFARACDQPRALWPVLTASPTSWRPPTTRPRA